MISPVLGNRLMVAHCDRHDDIGDGKRGILNDDGSVLLEIPTHLTRFDDIGKQKWFDNLDKPNYVEIIDVGLGCKTFTEDMGRRWQEDNGGEFGETLVCPRLWPKMSCMTVDKIEYYFPPESLFAPLLIREDGIKPIGSWVAVESNLGTEEEKGGISIRHDHQRPATSGNVIAVGPEVRRLAKGDCVVLPSAVKRFGYLGREISCLDENDILAVWDLS